MTLPAQASSAALAAAARAASKLAPRGGMGGIAHLPAL